MKFFFRGSWGKLHMYSCFIGSRSRQWWRLHLWSSWHRVNIILVLQIDKILDLFENIFLTLPAVSRQFLDGRHIILRKNWFDDLDFHSLRFAELSNTDSMRTEQEMLIRKNFRNLCEIFRQKVCPMFSMWTRVESHDEGHHLDLKHTHKARKNIERKTIKMKIVLTWYEIDHIIVFILDCWQQFNHRFIIYLILMITGDVLMLSYVCFVTHYMYIYVYY